MMKNFEKSLLNSKGIHDPHPTPPTRTLSDAHALFIMNYKHILGLTCSISKTSVINVGGRVVRSLYCSLKKDIPVIFDQLVGYNSLHLRRVGWGGDSFVYFILLSPPLSWRRRSHDKTEILLTGTLTLSVLN